MLFYFIKYFINEFYLSFWYFLSLFDETVENAAKRILSRSYLACVAFWKVVINLSTLTPNITLYISALLTVNLTPLYSEVYPNVNTA